MKYVYIIFFLILISCHNNTHTSEIIDKKEVFNQNLKNEICRLINLKKRYHYNKNAFCSIVLTKSNRYDKSNQCIIIASLTLGIDSLRITGYTFVENEFIACYLLTDSCNSKFISKNDLSTDRATIKEYFHLNNSIADGNYDLPSYVYKIDADSLVLMKTTEFH